MPQRHLSIAICFLVTGFFAAEIQAQQPVQYIQGSNGMQQPYQGQLQQQLAPVLDPMQALEAKVNSLQCQLDELRADNDSNSCESGCGAGFYGGAAAVFAKPHFKEAFQYSQTNFLTGQQSLIPFEYDYKGTPRVTLGYKGADGFGVRATYWDFDEDGQNSFNVADGINVYGAHAVSIIFPANIFAANPGEALSSSDSLRTQIQNYYVTYDTNVGGFQVSGGVGLRYALLEQSLNSVVLDPANAPIAQLSWQRRYDGLGPSVALDAKRRVGCTPFSVVANGGGALLFGTKTIDRTVFGDQSGQPTPPFLSLLEADEVVPVGELGFGVEWGRRLASGHNLMVRGQYEGSLWAEAGAPTLGFLGFEGFGVQVELKR